MTEGKTSGMYRRETRSLLVLEIATTRRDCGPAPKVSGDPMRGFKVSYPSQEGYA